MNYWKNKKDEKKDLEKAKNSLRDIVPVKDKLRQLKEGDKGLEELLDDATFNAELKNELGHELSRSEKKKVINKALEELDFD